MKKKILKSIYCMAVMFLTAGGLCLLPSVTSGQSTSQDIKLETQAASTFSSGTPSGGRENLNHKFSAMSADELDAEAESVENSAVERPDGTYYKIASVNDLALVSYMLYIGNEEWASRNYELVADINLANSLWTPIGNARAGDGVTDKGGVAFSGVFNGGYHTISNIAINDLSVPVDSDGFRNCGLFGIISGGKIENLTIKNFHNECSSTSQYTGALAGTVMNMPTITNCYVLDYEGLTDNAPNALGIVHSANIFRGGSRDGVTAHYTAESEINAAFKVAPGMGTPTLEGYAISYNSNGGQIVKYSSQTAWNDDAHKQYIYPNYGSNISTSGAIAAGFGAYGDMPISRTASMAAQNGVFAINEGNEFVLKAGTTEITDLTNVATLIQNGLIVTLDWADKNYSAVLHFGYNNAEGTERVDETSLVSLGNDKLWSSLIDTDLNTDIFTPQRVGYVLELNGAGIYLDEAHTKPINMAGGCFIGDADGLTDGVYHLYLEWTPRENIAYNINYLNASEDMGFDPRSAVSSIKVKEGAADINADDFQTGGTSGFSWDITNHNANKNVTIELTLNYGYTLNIGGGTANFVSSMPAVVDAGVYLAFGNGNYDSFVPTSAAITSDEAAHNKTYTITISNLVGSGQIHFAFVREEQTVELQGGNVTWTLSNTFNAKGESSPIFTRLENGFLYTRAGERFTVSAQATEENQYIVNYGYGYMGNYVTTDKSGLETVAGSDYATIYTVTMPESGFVYDFLAAGGKNAYIKAEAKMLVMQVVLTITQPAYENGGTPNLAVAGVIGNDTNETATSYKSFSAGITKDGIEIYLQSNAYYTLSSAENALVVTEEHNGLTSSTSIVDGFTRFSFNLQPIINENEDTIYHITITTTPVTYTLKEEIYIDGRIATDAELEKFFSAHGVSVASGKPWDKATYTLESSTAGAKRLYFEGTEIINEKTNNAQATENLTAPALNGSEFTFGTYNTTIRSNYTYKTLTINLSNVAIVSNVNNSGSQTELQNAINVFKDNAESSAPITSITTTADVDGLRLTADVGSIDIINGYYLLGWYLKNGELTSTDYSASLATVLGISADGLVSSDVLALLGSDRNTVVTINPTIVQKTVTLKFAEGEDPYYFISYKNPDADGKPRTDDGSAVIGVEYTYYHNQETFKGSDGTIFGGKGAFSFKNNNLDQLFKKIAAANLTGYKTIYNENSTIFPIENGAFSTVDFGVTYGNENNVILTFTPEFNNLLNYEIKIVNTINSEVVTLNIKLGQTLTMSNATNAGDVTYTISEGDTVVASVTTQTLAGYSALPSKEFILTGFDKNQAINTTEKINSFTFDGENVGNFLNPNYYYTSTKEAFTATTQFNPNPYRIYLSYNGTYEKLDTSAENNPVKMDEDGVRQYVDALYNQSIESLKNVAMTREGYKLIKWVRTTDGAVVLEKVDSVWADANYTYAGDITVRPMWEADSSAPYVSASASAGKTIYFNGSDQTLSTVTLSTLKAGEVVEVGKTLDNGDLVVSAYWAEVGEDGQLIPTSQTGANLQLKDVQKGSYQYVINLRSQGLLADDYSVKLSAPINVEIKKNQIVVKNSHIQSYYTGTNDIVPTSANAIGGLYYRYSSDGVDNAGAAIDTGIVNVESVRFAGDSHKIVGDGYTVVYAIAFAGANADNFEKADQGAYSASDTLTVNAADGNTAEVVKTRIVFKVSGSGLYAKNKLHIVPYTVAGLSGQGVDFNEYGITASATITTIDWQARAYTGASDFKVENFEVRVNGTPATTNFDYSLDNGVYTISQASKAYTFNVGKLTAEGDGETLSLSYTGVKETLTITGVTYTTATSETKVATINLSSDFCTLYDGSSIVLTIFGNGTSSVTVSVSDSYTATVTAIASSASDSNFVFLGYFAENEDYKAKLDEFSQSPDSAKSYEVGAIETINVVYTNVKSITINSGENGKSKKVYASISSTITFKSPDWNGFVLTGYSDSDKITTSISQDRTTTLTLDETADILPASITATWALDMPNAVTKDILKKAGEGNVTISTSDIFDSFTNRNNDAITYSYEFFKGATSLGVTEGSFTIPANTSSNDTYYVIITAQKAGYAAVFTEKLPFEIEIEKISLSASIADATLEYANKDYAEDINVTLTIDGKDQTKKLSALLNGQFVKFSITRTAGENTTSANKMKDYGSYEISLWADPTIYDATAFTKTINIAKKRYEFTASDNVSFKKYVGTIDPIFSLNVTINFEQGTQETIKVTFARVTQDDTIDSETGFKLHDLDSATTNNENYELSVAAGNEFLRVEQANAVLQVEVVNPGVFHKIYNKQNTIFKAVFAEGKWTLYAFNADADTSNIANAINNAWSDLRLWAYNEDNSTTEEIADATELQDAFKSTIQFAITGDNLNVKEGGYEVGISNNSEGNYYSSTVFTTPLMFVVDKAQIEIESVSKNFDRTNEFTNAHVQVKSGIVEGDTVTFSGTFASVHAGTHALTFTLSGADAGNYEIQNPEIKGTILPSDENVTISITNSLVYGQIKDTSDLISMLKPVLTIGAGDTIYEDAVADGFVTISDITITSANYSSSNGLKVGDYEVVITLSSTDYSKANGAYDNGETPLTLTINFLGLDLSDTVISKQYNGDTKLPKNLSWIIKGIIAGDEVIITGEFADAEVGENKAIDFDVPLGGADGANYEIKVLPNIREITEANAQLNVNINDKVEYLPAVGGDKATTNDFVSDGESVNANKTIFNFDYPVDDAKIAEYYTQLINNLPTRTGYGNRADYWFFLREGTAEGGEVTRTEVVINASNLKTILGMAFDKSAENGLTIYPHWTRENVSVTLNLQHASAQASTGVSSADNVYTIPYFSDLTLEITADTGYKFTGMTVDGGTIYGGAKALDAGKRTGGKIELKQVKTDSEITVLTEELQINVTIDENVPAYSSLVELGWSEKTNTYNYSETGAVVNLLPTSAIALTAGTYTLSGWSVTFGGKTTTLALSDETTLSQIVGTEIEEDTPLTFKAQWTGVKYTINFNVNDTDAMVDKASITDVEFGKAITETFAVATKKGHVNTWNTQADDTGETYKQGDETLGVLRTIGTADTENNYSLTLYAIWSAGSATLTVEFSDKKNTSVSVAGNTITSGDTFDLVYSDTTFIYVTVNTQAGYSFSATLGGKALNEQTVAETANISGNRITINKLSENATLVISKVANQNTLEIAGANFNKDFDVQIGNETSTKRPIIAATGSVVRLEFAASAGYEFTASTEHVDGEPENYFVPSKNYANRTGSGDIVQRVDKTTGHLIVTWSGFTAGARITISPDAKMNEITISDAAGVVTKVVIQVTGENDLTITLNKIGEPSALQQGSFSIATGKTFTMVVTLKYGYQNIALTYTTVDDITKVDGVESFGADKVYSNTFTLSGFTCNLEINISAQARSYNFAASVNQGDEDKGGVNITTAATATFGQYITLEATPTASNRFTGWYVGETYLGSANPFTFTLNAENKDILETLNDSGEIEFVGHFGLDETVITIESGANGSLSYTIDSDAAVTVEAGKDKSPTVRFGSTIVITPSAYSGFEVKAVSFLDENGNPLSDEILDGWREDGKLSVGENSAISITIIPSELAKIKVEFGAKEAIINVSSTVQINLVQHDGSNIGGRIDLCGEHGGVPVDGEIVETGKPGLLYKVKANTNQTIYFAVTENTGYTCNLTSSGTAIINESTLPDGRKLYKVSSFTGEINLRAVFVAIDNKVGIYFVREGQEDAPVPAGSISVPLTAQYVAVNNNNSSALDLSIITSSPLTTYEIQITLSTNFSYTFVKEEDGKPKIAYGSLKKPDLTTVTTFETPTERGLTQQSVMTLSGINSDGNIYIYVKPKEYKINFYDGYSREPIATLEHVIYGQTLDVAELPKARDEYIFKGYYTYANGEGKQYFDENGKPKFNWLEQGYELRGSGYSKVDYFHPADGTTYLTDTFDLYAAWSYTKEKITIEFVPRGIEKTNANVTISNFIVSLNDTIAWTVAGEAFYAEVKVGQEIVLQPYNFEGYKFKRWIITRDGGTPNPIDITARYVNGRYEYQPYSYTSENGDVLIEAVYEPLFDIDVYDDGLQIVDEKRFCGDAYLMQDGKRLGLDESGRGSYDTSKQITLVAVEKLGYNFKGWYDKNAGRFLVEGTDVVFIGTENDVIDDKPVTIKRYVYRNNPSSTISLRAVFEGAEVVVRFDTTNFEPNGHIDGFKINGVDAGFSSSFTARVGDTLTLTISTEFNYGVTWGEASEGATEQVVFEEKDGQYTYRVSARALDRNGVLVIRPVADAAIINYNFNIFIGDRENPADELELVGTLKYENDRVTHGYTASKKYGQSVVINVSLLPNYTIQKVCLNIYGRPVPIPNAYNDELKVITIPSTVLEENRISEVANIVITYARLLWSENISEGLQGNGTESSPFLITSAKDLAFLAYAVNNGLLHESGLAYTDANYRITRNIDLSGRYWVPFGIDETHQFNGIIDAGNFEVTNISLTPEMRNASTSFGGLLLHTTARAKVVRSDNILPLALGISFGVLALILLIVLIVILARRKKKKKLEELANS